MINTDPDETLGELVDFVITKRHPKTNVWNVMTKKRKMLLGEIRWYGRWKRYMFRADDLALFEQNILKDIMLFLEVCMEKHKRENSN